MNNKKHFLLVIFSLAFVLMYFTGCESSTESNSENYSSFFPMKVGNEWFYSYYTYNNPPDENKVALIKKIIGTRSFGNEIFYQMKETFYNADTVSFIDTNYYRIWGDKLYCRYSWNLGNPNILGVFSMNRDEKRFIPENEEIKQYITVTEKTGSTITFFYDTPQIVDEEYQEQYKKGFGLYDSFSYWGIGFRLVEFKESK